MTDKQDKTIIADSEHDSAKLAINNTLDNPEQYRENSSEEEQINSDDIPLQESEEEELSFFDKPFNSNWDNKKKSWDDEKLSWDEKIEKKQNEPDEEDEEDESWDYDYDDEEEEEDEEELKGKGVMPFWQHLEELRWVIIKCIITLVISTAIGLAFVNKTQQMIIKPITKQEQVTNAKKEPLWQRIKHLFKKDKEKNEAKQKIVINKKNAGFMKIKFRKFEFVLSLPPVPAQTQTIPKKNKGITLIYSSPLEGFVTRIKLGILGGFIFSLPFLTIFIWSFISPALTVKERRPIWIGAIVGLVFFCIGVTLGYNFIPLGLSALLKFGDPNILNLWPFKEWISFSFKLMLAFGIIFELPVVLSILIKLNVIKVKMLEEKRMYAVVITLIVAAILTPPDPVTMIGLALPLIFLYEASIIAGKFINRWFPVPEADDDEDLENLESIET